MTGDWHVNESGLLFELGVAATLALPKRQEMDGFEEEAWRIDRLPGFEPRKESVNLNGKG